MLQLLVLEKCQPLQGLVVDQGAIHLQQLVSGVLELLMLGQVVDQKAALHLQVLARLQVVQAVD